MDGYLARLHLDTVFVMTEVSMENERQARIRIMREVGYGLKRGYYETEYGNTCFVSGPKAKTAKDLDMEERVPIAMVVDASTWHAKPGDRQ